MVANEDGPHYSDGEISEVSTFQFTEKELEDDWRQEDLVKLQDAEDAIQKARQQERQEILGHISKLLEQEAKDFEQKAEETAVIFEQDRNNSLARRIRNLKEDLRDDLQESDNR